MNIKFFSFSVLGLKVVTSNKTVTLDPRATCELLQSLNQIDDFTSDRNGEPVILFVDHQEPTGYGYQMWCDFVKTFRMMKSEVRVLVQHLDDQACFARSRAIIANLLPTTQRA